MIPIARGALPAVASRRLATLEAEVARGGEDLDIEKVWSRLSGEARLQVQETLRSMCSGIERCMYCEDSQGTDIEHFWPKKPYPEKAFRWSNYLMACSYCNSNQKRDVFPVVDGAPGVIDPSIDDPFEHLSFTPSTGFYTPLTLVGERSIRLFGLNRSVCARGRKNAWDGLCILFEVYGEKTATQQDAMLRVISEYPFQGVRRWVRIIAERSSSEHLIGRGVRDAIAAYPELVG